MDDATTRNVEFPREDTISLLDIALVLARNRAFIARTVLVFIVLGLAYSFLAPKKFVAGSEVVREAPTEGGRLPGGFSSGALSSFGINLNQSGGGLSPQAYPRVLESREVRLGVVRDTFHFPDADAPMTFLEYTGGEPSLGSQILKYTLYLPWTLKAKVSQSLPESDFQTGAEDDSLYSLTPREQEAIKDVKGLVTTSVDQESGLMNIYVTASSPRLAAELANSFIDHLSARVRSIRTEKVRERLKFVQQRFREAEQELKAAEERLTSFLERNQKPNSAQLQFQQDRLRRQVSFKEQLYGDLQSQLTQTQLDLQRRQPVVTVVERPIPPKDRSSPDRTLIMILSVLLGGIVGVLGAFLRTVVAGEGDDERQEKIEEIRNAFALNGSWEIPWLRSTGGEPETTEPEDQFDSQPEDRTR
jgi:uncharacterized protein involved in exopolysaccharide biosynthesis